MSLEANFFPIRDFSSISSQYVLYRIRGLNNAPEEYFQNRQNIVKKLSYVLQSPVTIIDRDGSPFLVVSSDSQPPPDNLPLVRTIVKLERCSEAVTLDYSVRSPDNDKICLRFLDFIIQGYLHHKQTLWQPSAGRPFFEKQIAETIDNLARFWGYSIRATISPDGQLGFCIDVASKAVAKQPLPTHITHDQFARWKNRSFVYHYGHQWYEVQLIALSDLNASELMIPGTQLSLLEWAVKECEKPIPRELADVSFDASVGIYLNNRNESRSALLPLCYAVYKTSDDNASRQHGYTILQPHRRYRMVVDFVEQYLGNVQFGRNSFSVSASPAQAESRIFSVPDQLFGNGKLLSVRGTPNTQHTSLDRLGEARMALLKDKRAGFYEQSPLDRQYLILPRTVADSYGRRFIDDLKQAMNEFYSLPYNPIVVAYNDLVAKTFAKQGNAILDAVQQYCQKPGYTVVMLHHLADGASGEEDELAAMVIRKLRAEADISAAVIHSTVSQECYCLVQRNGLSEYEPRKEKWRKLQGYLQMVAINKILLTNHRWPFLLGTKLHADLTIGLDVKHNTAGFVVVGKNGGEINTRFKTSRQQEKLEKDKIKAYLIEIIREEAKTRSAPINTIVLQRDGRVFDTECQGAREAVERLKAEGILPATASITIVEIPKTSPVRLRLFDTNARNGRLWIENPQVGTYRVINDSEGYVCTTGRAFPRPGTVNPLHVRLVEGALSIEACLEDMFCLACLAWTRPNDCSRFPITIKLNDRFLAEEANDFDENALEIEAILTENDEREEEPYE